MQGLLLLLSAPGQIGNPDSCKPSIATDTIIIMCMSLIVKRIYTKYPAIADRVKVGKSRLADCAGVAEKCKLVKSVF